MRIVYLIILSFCSNFITITPLDVIDIGYWWKVKNWILIYGLELLHIYYYHDIPLSPTSIYIFFVAIFSSLITLKIGKRTHYNLCQFSFLLFFTLFCWVNFYINIIMIYLFMKQVIDKRLLEEKYLFRNIISN